VEFLARYANCPSCGKYFVYVRFGDGPVSDDDPMELLWPKHATVKPFPVEVPTDIVAEFNEAHNVLGDSPKASAALSRRLLQRILTEKSGVLQRDLVRQIEAVLPSLPSYLQDSLYVRPAVEAGRRADLNRKLAEAGKPPLK
jgi:hypothetical protein